MDGPVSGPYGAHTVPTGDFEPGDLVVSIVGETSFLTVEVLPLRDHPSGDHRVHLVSSNRNTLTSALRQSEWTSAKGWTAV